MERVDYERGGYVHSTLPRCTSTNNNKLRLTASEKLYNDKVGNNNFPSLLRPEEKVRLHRGFVVPDISRECFKHVVMPLVEVLARHIRNAQSYITGYPQLEKAADLFVQKLESTQERLFSNT